MKESKILTEEERQNAFKELILNYLRVKLDIN